MIVDRKKRNSPLMKDFVVDTNIAFREDSVVCEVF